LPPTPRRVLCYSTCVRLAQSLLFIGFVCCSWSSWSCTAVTGGDPHSNNGIPPANGRDKKIRELGDPSIDGHAEIVGTAQPVSGAIVTAVDNFDETQNGKGTGTIYVQDIDATKDTPYAGVSLFAPTFNPGNLAVNVGDVLDLRGNYTENTQIPSKPPVIFAPGAILPQLSQPFGTFRYETTPAKPIDIDINDLTDFAKGRRWMGMLVRVQNLTVTDKPYLSNGRESVSVTPVPQNAQTNCDAPFPKVATIVNDLTPLTLLVAKQKGETIKSIVGVVGFFCSIKIAPRSAADIQL
jgi:hypothetical protein